MLLGIRAPPRPYHNHLPSKRALHNASQEHTAFLSPLSRGRRLAGPSSLPAPLPGPLPSPDYKPKNGEDDRRATPPSHATTSVHPPARNATPACVLQSSCSSGGRKDRQTGLAMRLDGQIIQKSTDLSTLDILRLVTGCPPLSKVLKLTPVRISREFLSATHPTHFLPYTALYDVRRRQQYTPTQPRPSD